MRAGAELMGALWLRVSDTMSSKLSPRVAAALGLLLALAAQLARIPLDCPTLFPYITYLPFIMVSACIGGLASGLVITFL